MQRNESFFLFCTQAKRWSSFFAIIIWILLSAESEAVESVVHAKVGDTANFTWLYESLDPNPTKVTLCTFDNDSKISLIIGMAEGSKVNFNPILKDSEFKDRVDFYLNTDGKTATFLLKNVKESDGNRNFGITVDNSKTVFKLISRLEIVELPQFIVRPVATSEVNEGEKLMLNCEASGKPIPKIVWRLKGSKAVLASDFGKKELVFSSINRLNQSDYQCEASNIAGRIDQDVMVLVNYRPKIDVEKSSKTVYSYVGNPKAVTLTCVADGRPSPSYYWKDNFGLNVSYQSSYSLVEPKDAQLGFPYQCFAANKVGISEPYLVKVEKLEKPGTVIAKLTRRTSRTLSIKWTLPNDTGGAPLVAVLIGITDPLDQTIKRSFKPEVTNTTFEDLQPFSEYKLEFVTKNQVLDSLPIELKVKTDEEAPSAPQNLRSPESRPRVERELKIEWTSPTAKNGIIRYYEVAFGHRFANSYNVETAQKLKTTKTNLTLKGLLPYARYSIQVRAATIAPGPWSKVLQLMTDLEAPTAPRNLSYQSVNADSVLLVWAAPQFIYGPIATAEAKIRYKRNGQWHSKNEYMFASPLPREWRLEVIPYADYEIQIREATGVERKWGPLSNTCSFRTPEGVPATPVDVKITHRTTRTISLSWHRPGNINGILTHFIVFYENATQRYEERIRKDLRNQTFRHRLNNLNLATKYTIIVQAFTAAGGGKMSDPVATETSSPFKAPRKKPNDEIAAGPIIGGIFSFLVILVLLVILILYIARKQRQSKNGNLPQLYEDEDSPLQEQRLLSPPGCDEKVPDVVTTNGRMPVAKQNSCEERATRERCFISSRPIKLNELKDVCDRLHANKDAGFIQEFKGITPRQNDLTLDISLRLENKCKNRYNNILAYDHSRVILSYIENIPGSDYINANYVDGYSKKKKFIATQGPVAASFNDFWRMVWEQNADIIVMVTNLIEKSRIKCQKYWPTGDSREYGSIRVTPEEEMELAEYVVRKFSVSMVSGNKKHGSRKVTQYQFTGWPDHGVPQYATGLLQFIRKIRLSAQDCAGPIICHCSAGVGRSGTFLTLDSMLDQIKSEGTVDVHGYVTHIRSQRNFMVQTEAQYIFIHDALLEAVICGETEIAVKDLSNQIQLLSETNAESGNTYIQEEFERLSYNLEENHVYEAGFLAVNASKNRFPSVVPIESTRLKLWPYPEIEGSDYINANFVDGYQQREAFILTQAPMANTVEDFWRMIWEYEVFSIVMLTSREEHNEEHCFPYWPYNSEPANIGLLIIQIAAEENKEGFVKREFRATNSKTGETRVVTHFMYYAWPEEMSPEDPSFLIAMIGQLQKAQQITGNGSVAIHCSDGCGRSGAIAAMIFCIERLKVEGIVDVFQTVRMMRTQRPHVVRSLDHYLFCYNAVKKFVDKFSDYANFK